MLRPISNAPRLYLRPSHRWHSVLVLIVDDIFGNIPSILIQSPASNSPRAVHSSLRLPCLWEQPIFATDTELITTDLVQCTYPQTTRSSAALESSRPSESWMWLGTKYVALKICSSYSELKELTQKIHFLNDNAIHGATEINTTLKIENLVPRNWRNMKTHNLISGVKSEDTYKYFLDYTKPLTCIGCHIGFIFIRSDRVWLNILLDNKNPRFRHQNRCLVPRLLDTLYFGDYANSL